ncbi:urea amidolyase family protein [Paracoccus aestuariivivens]|uniref:5-oxoprolinase/urea amidolyase family protein n=1 Tax=Paracoccus aestuariivivens TaxID=1820333 RepID=A0A6L6JE82_9RHOB|nr:urea amidolyase family protein [Paracoccus aestuariivivens]MTH79049.1 5-oxoprolinase/urea amidolyase family protein [Paracoccus aestuariivivens]
MTVTFLPVGPRTLLIELPDLAETLVLFDALNANPVPGIAEIIPAARTLMVRTELGTPADGRLAAEILKCRPPPGTVPAQNTSPVIELPVTYDGEDLAEVAQLMRLSVPEVIAAHQAATWQVAFCGFAPGFAYMTCDDPRFDVARRSSPRTRIPAGSVALAGRFSGIYPLESPGGWQLIGRTDVPMFDLSRDPAALLAPGQRVRFVEAAAPARAVAPKPTPATQGLKILSTAFPITVQDEGRPGQGGQGVSASGALDIGSMRRANRRVGNPSGTPVLEITLGPSRLTADRPVTIALEGAADRAEIEVDGIHTAVDLSRPFALDASEVLILPPPQRGMRSYLAVRGGFDVPPVMGSASRDTLAHIGPEPLTNGAVLPLANTVVGAVDAQPTPQLELPENGDLVEIPVRLGPRTDWFPSETVDQFLTQEWTVSPLSSRVGMRLEGPRPLTRDTRELPSEGTETGAIQIPHSGQPVFFLADHPLTGGYPVIATVLPEALDLAAQIPPGARIRFVAAAPFAPIFPEADA